MTSDEARAAVLAVLPDHPDRRIEAGDVLKRVRVTCPDAGLVETYDALDALVDEGHAVQCADPDDGWEMYCLPWTDPEWARADALAAAAAHVVEAAEAFVRAKDEHHHWERVVRQPDWPDDAHARRFAAADAGVAAGNDLWDAVAELRRLRGEG